MKIHNVRLYKTLLAISAGYEDLDILALVQGVSLGFIARNAAHGECLVIEDVPVPFDMAAQGVTDQMMASEFSTA